MKNLKNLFKHHQNGPHNFRAEVADDEASVYLYDPIGDWYGLSATDFVQEINGMDVSTIHLRINSPGGDVFDARAMQVGLKQHKAKVIAHIDGVAASAATYIAMAADEVEMAEGAFFMIHNAWTLMYGNAIEMREQADLLDKIDGSIVTDYRKKTGQSDEQIKEWMAAETWFTADEALEHGFVDRIYEGKDVDNFDLSAYSNAPKKPAPVFDRAELERRLTLVDIGA